MTADTTEGTAAATASRTAPVTASPRKPQSSRFGEGSNAPPAACRIAPADAKIVGKPVMVCGKSTTAVIRTVTVPEGVISTSGVPGGGGSSRRGVKTAEQTAASGSSLSGSGHSPATFA